MHVGGHACFKSTIKDRKKFLKLFSKDLFMCMSVLSVRYIALYLCLVLPEIRSSGIGVLISCEPPNRCWELNLGLAKLTKYT